MAGPSEQSGLSAADFFRSLQKKTFGVHVLKGEDSYLKRELIDFLRKQNLEIEQHALAAQGPRRAILDVISQTGFFSTGPKGLIITSRQSVSAWDDEAWSTWEEMKSMAESGDAWVAVMVPRDQRMKWNKLGAAEWNFEIETQDRMMWIRRAMKRKNIQLSDAAVMFLTASDSNMEMVENSLELWHLGGDDWARASLGFGSQSQLVQESGLGHSNDSQLAFQWVDAALGRSVPRYKALTGELFATGHEPFQLMGLLGKSVRILASVQSRGVIAKAEVPFLVQKIQRSRAPAGWGEELLHRLAQLDEKVKSSPWDIQAGLVQLVS